MVYNCFINCQNDNDYQTKNRVSTSLDMFPTMLSALGFTWNGNRLGLGTNLFSTQKTITEELGYDYFNAELSKKSQFYIDTFS